MENDSQYIKELEKLQSKLLAHGWESEVSVSQEYANVIGDKLVLARFVNSFCHIVIHSYFNKKSFLVEIMTNEDKRLPNIIMNGIKDVSSVLNVFMNNQEKISEEAYPGLLELLIPFCEIVLLETDQGLIRASL